MEIAKPREDLSRLEISGASVTFPCRAEVVG